MSDRRKVIAPIALLALFMLFAAGLVAMGPGIEREEAPRELLTVRVLHPVVEDVGLRVRSQGTVAPRTESTLIPEISGRVVELSPALVSGGFFEQGDVLLRIDPRDYEADVARARARLARAAGEMKHARRTLARQADLAKRSVNSGADYDDARRDAAVSEADVAEARVALEQSLRDLERTEIRAPFDGRVRDESIDVGQFAERGRAVATLYATDYVEVRLPIPDHELAYLDLRLWGPEGAEGVGPAVFFHANFAGAEHVWKGRVVRTEGEIDSRSRMVNVVARVEDPYAHEEGVDRPPLAVGLFVRAEISGHVAESVIAVPRVALRGDGNLLVVDREGRLRLRAVEVVRRERDRALVRAELASGENICVSPLQVVVEGMRVNTEEVTSEEVFGEGQRS